jgi:DNA-binding transcriptional MerR regulator
MAKRKTQNPKCTHCKLCGVEYNERFVGRKCRECNIAYLRAYHADPENNKRHSENSKYKRQMKKLLEPPKPPRKSRRIYTDEQREERIKLSRYKGRLRYHIKKTRDLITRTSPIKKRNIDREWYVDNHTYETSLYHLSFDAIKDCPMEHFDTSYWTSYYETLSVEMIDYIKDRDYQKYIEDRERYNSSYTKPDKEYGISKEGKLRFWPT